METIERENHGAVLGGGDFRDGVIYKGDLGEYMEFVEDINLEIEGDTYTTDRVKIAHGDGEMFTIYSDMDAKGKTIWVDTENEYSEDGELLDTMYYFGVFE